MDGRQLLMAFDKIIDSAQLESDLTSVAAAIRAKGATAAPLNFPAGFVSAVNNIFTSSAFGYIVASFPVTATSCTCSSGGTVLEADAAGLARGQFVFEVPAAGTWTVTISNGTDTKSESVSITAAGQAEAVKLSFSLYLFTEGVGVSEGFTFNAIRSGEWKVSNDFIQWSTRVAIGNAIWATPALDVSNYTTLSVELEGISKNTGSTVTQTNITIGVGADVPKSASDGGAWAAKTTVAYSTTRAVYSVDITDIADTMPLYVKITAPLTTGKIYNIYLM